MLTVQHASVYRTKCSCDLCLRIFLTPPPSSTAWMLHVADRPNLLKDDRRCSTRRKVCNGREPWVDGLVVSLGPFFILVVVEHDASIPPPSHLPARDSPNHRRAASCRQCRRGCVVVAPWLWRRSLEFVAPWHRADVASWHHAIVPLWRRGVVAVTSWPWRDGLMA